MTHEDPASVARKITTLNRIANEFHPVPSLAGRTTDLLTFINLVENAIKYSVKPVIEVSSWNAGPDFCISVKDNGIGINPAHHKKIFDRFYRITHGDLHTVKGFGLGLNFVKKVIDAHGGKIEVQSEEKKGSTFIVRIPGKNKSLIKSD